MGTISFLTGRSLATKKERKTLLILVAQMMLSVEFLSASYAFCTLRSTGEGGCRSYRQSYGKHYCTVTQDWVMPRGTMVGPKQRIITLRKLLLPQVSGRATEKIELKVITTSPRDVHGRLQVSEENF